jgi:hypothetical protein
MRQTSNSSLASQLSPSLNRQHRLRRSSIVILAAAVCVQWTHRAQGATESWTGTTGNWAVAGNWSSGVPAAGDTVNITDDDNTSRNITYNYTGSAIILGTLTVDNDGPSGTNTLSMTGTGTALAASNENIGDSGTSTLQGFAVMTQSVGTNSITNTIALGNGAKDMGTYNLSSTGTLVSAIETMGVNGTGSFTQSGGTNTITNSGEFNLGNNSGSSGSYILSGGTISCDGGESVGVSGTGNFSQSNGINDVVVLFVAEVSTGNGTYSLSNTGAINSNSEYVGVGGAGTFIQSGGTNSITAVGSQPLYLGYNAASSGYYSLSDGTLSCTAVGGGGNEYIGYGGSGTFVQSGGTNSVSGNVYVGDSTNGGTGSLSVSGGLLSISGNLVAANSAFDTISLSAGTISLGGLTLNGNSSFFEWTGGTLDFMNGVTIDKSFALGASLNLTGGLTLSSEGTLNDNGQITVSPGAGLSAPLINISGILNYLGGTISASVYTVGEGGSFNINSALTNATSIDVATGGGVQVNGVSLTNNGVIQVQSGGLISGTGTLSNSISGIITGSGNIGMSVTNNGTIQSFAGLMAFTGAVTNPGTISAPVGGEVLLEDMPANAGNLSLDGGTISTNGATLHNTGQILGYGILSTGGLNNDGTIAFAGESSVYGPVTNRSAGLIHLSGSTLNVFYGAVTNNGQFTVDAGASGSIYGAYTGSGPILDNGSLYLNANSVAGPISGTGFLTIGSTSSGPAVVQLNAGSGLSTQDALTVAANSTFDLDNNHFIINYGSAPDPIATIRAYLISGYNGGAWNGSGIDSSAANSHYGLGYADSADPGNPAALASGQIEIKYTLYGDANLDGVVNGSDFTILAGSLGKAVTGWDKGDFNYDGVVNATDFTLLIGNLGKSATGADVAIPAADYEAIDAFAAANGLMAEVPEPGSAGLLLAAGLGFMTRRRRKCRSEAAAFAFEAVQS